MLVSIRLALSRSPGRIDVEHRGRAAVSMLVLPNQDLLFIRRTVKPHDPWSGHVSFPGGRMDPVDPDPLATALRETREEVGIDLDRGQLLGELDEITTIGVDPPIVIRPFVFAIDEPGETSLQVEEVAGIHRLALGALLAGHGRGEMTWRRRDQEWRLPCVDFDGVRLWGLTLHMVDDLLHRLDGGGMGLERVARRDGAAGP